MPFWPQERVSKSFPFQFVGLDYFGPLNVSVPGSTQKMWVSLFSCLTTRALLLKPVVDCPSREFLEALIRFVSRRGCPEEIISDNGAQFKLVSILGDKACKGIPTDPQLLSYITHQGIHWKFIVELAPCQGGHYERLVGVVKFVLKTAADRRLLSWSYFVTLLAEAEAVVNSRSISYVPEHIDAFSPVLRPIDFITSSPTAIDQNENPLRPKDFGEAGKQLVSIW